MLEAMSHVGVWVQDQDEAKAFYADKLGFEVREDATLEDFGGYRWLTVGPPGQPELNLILSRPGPPAMDPETAAKVLELAQEPVERFYGIDATFRDPSGNLWRIVQPLDRP